MTRSQRGSQRSVVMLAAAVFVLVGLGLLAVLVVGLMDGITGTGPMVLGALAIGVFVLAARLFGLARGGAHTTTKVPSQPSAATRRRPAASTPAPASASNGAPRPGPRPKGRPAGH